MDDEVDGRGDLLADRAQRQLIPGHEDHGLEPAEHVRGGVRVTGRQRTVLTGRHGLEHVQRLAGTALPDDDAVGAHVQGVAQQVPDRDLARALDVRRARLERHDVDLTELQLRGVLDRDDPLVLGDERGQDVEGRRLARARAAGHEDIQPGPDAGVQEVEHLGRRRAEPDEVVHRDWLGWKLPDGDDRPDQRERFDDRIHAGTVGQPRVDPRARGIDAPSKRRDDPVDDAQDVLVVQEIAVDSLDLACPLDIHVAWPVDHDLRDRLVEQERIERPEAPDLPDQLLDQVRLLVTRDRKAFRRDDAFDDRRDFGAELVRIREVEKGVEGGHDLGLKPEPDLVQQLLAGRAPFRADRDRDRRRGGTTGTAAAAALASAVSRSCCCARSTRWINDMTCVPLSGLRVAPG